MKQPTHYENILDLFFVSNPSLIYNSQVIPGISKDGHHAVYVEQDISLTRRKKKPRKIYSHKKADWEKMKAHMKEAGDSILRDTTEATPVDNILSSFTIALQKAIDMYVPTSMSKSREKSPWISPETKRLIRKQRDLFRKQKGINRASLAAQHYRSLKAFTQRSIKKDYWKYVDGLITDKEDEPPISDKRFWKFMKHQRQEAQGVAPLKNNGKLEDDPVKKASILNAQFQSFFSPRSPLSLKALSTRVAGFLKSAVCLTIWAGETYASEGWTVGCAWHAK